MSEHGRGPGGGPKGSGKERAAGRKVGAAVTTSDPGIEAPEERALRMLRGAPVADDAPLGQKDDGLPDEVRARLRAIEAAAFEKAGRMDELLAETDAELQEIEQREARKHRIVRRLREPSGGGEPS